jgi:hypothetical protein
VPQRRRFHGVRGLGQPGEEIGQRERGLTLEAARVDGDAQATGGLPKTADAVESAALRHIDWRREVEQIKANSTR